MAFETRGVRVGTSSRLALAPSTRRFARASANDAEIRVPTRVPIPDANDPRDARASTRFDFDSI
jgi:hypothetical protein